MKCDILCSNLCDIWFMPVQGTQAARVKHSNWSAHTMEKQTEVHDMEKQTEVHNLENKLKYMTYYTSNKSCMTA